MPAKNPTDPKMKKPFSSKGESAQESHGRIQYGPIKSEGMVEEENSGRERLKRHRVEVAGRVWVPELWGQEDFLKDWIDCGTFDAAVMSSSVILAKAALVEEGRRANSAQLGIKNGC